MSGFTVATIVFWNGSEGVAEDAYNEFYKFTPANVAPMDLNFLEVGKKVTIPEDGVIELASSSFVRYVEEEISFREETTEELLYENE